MSPTYLSGVVIVIIALLNFFKINISESELLPIVEGLITAVLGINIIYRRLKVGDINVFGKKIEEK